MCGAAPKRSTYEGFSREGLRYHRSMKRVDVEEFSRNTDLYVQLANAGETVEITEAGVPVAKLTPVPVPGQRTVAFQEMVDAGLVIPAESELRDIEPLPATPGEKPLSQLLQEMRDDER